jgi:hypothetical protein
MPPKQIKTALTLCADAILCLEGMHDAGFVHRDVSFFFFFFFLAKNTQKNTKKRQKNTKKHRKTPPKMHKNGEKWV